MIVAIRNGRRLLVAWPVVDAGWLRIGPTGDVRRLSFGRRVGIVVGLLGFYFTAEVGA